MGYAKYHEDDFGFVCERLFSSAIASEEKNKEFIRLLKCPYCQESFDSKKGLFAHIKSKHNILKPILMVNGSVVGESVYLSDVKSVVIHMYGFDDNIFIDGKQCLYDSDEYGIIDITDIVAEQFSANRSCKLTIGDRTINLNSFSLKTINQEVLFEYIDKWDVMLKNREPLLMNNISKDNLNDAEYFYLEGVFNYFVACQANGKDKNDRYNEANSILKKFVPINSLGLCIQKIVAFRLNWVHTLDYLCRQYETNDNFNKILDFFGNRESEDKSVLSDNLRDLYIEDDLLSVFEAIVCFQNKDYDSVNKYLSDYNDTSILKLERNLADKILLLKSRMKIVEGNKSEANYYRREIICEEFK